MKIGSSLPAVMLLLVAVAGCKQATGLRAGGLYAAGPILVHEPMGIEGVRFRYRKTGVDFEHRQALLEAGGGGQSTTQRGSVATTTTTSVYSRSGNETKKGIRDLSARTWAAGVHVDLGRWTFFPLFFFVGRAYVEAQGDLIDVEVAR